ncbi:response regulator transcription factor [Methylobacillus flagellatus]|uniref:response regulator transcription factor n=1 Tax=Methylobacillus flagellatus TaxID=405 RepID=UPI002853E0EF|nr:response regulator transcription factor [Methylobacillus flagellatus]MDR5171712.1 response regulator transcription factor [Methylobacillus flagellatus]
MAKVLLIDDDVELVNLIREYLVQEGFDVECAHDGETGVVYAESLKPALIVLDVMMPKLNGIEVLRRIRASSNVPVLMLTAKGDDEHRIVGLELGADDYVPKPCTPRELVARIRAILRRIVPTDQQPQAHHIAVGPLTLWPERRLVEWAGQPVNLTSTEFNLLEVLVRQAGRVVSKSDLSTLGLGRPLSRFDRTIDVHLSSIRQKLGTLADGRQCIQTVYRMGYQLIKE